MTGGTLPSILLIGALGLVLGFAQSRIWPWAIVAACAGAATPWLVTPPAGWTHIAYVGCWASLAITAAAVHRASFLGTPLLAALAFNVGVWASAPMVVAGSPAGYMISGPFLIVALPSKWLVRHSAAIGVKVAASWLIAIAVLVMALPFLPVTPGYLPDHLE